MNSIETKVIKTPIGELILGSFRDQLCLLDFLHRRMRSTVDRRLRNGLDAEFRSGGSDVVESAVEQLNEYLNHERTTFAIPFLTVGTEFQKSVWRELLEVKFGETASYQEIANRIGKPDAVRAVAAANGANAMSILIPCHRIIGTSGELTGYGGGLAVKKRLLNMESRGLRVGYDDIA